MANSNTPCGLKAVRILDGSPYNGQVMKFVVKAAVTNAIGIGDPILWNGSADDDGVPSCDIATVGATYKITGVVAAFEPIRSNLNTVYRASAAKDDDYYCYVVADPNAIFTIQDDGGAALTADSVGLNSVLINASTVNTSTGISGAEMDAGTTTAPSADATYQFLILGLTQLLDNAIGVNAFWDVLINLHSLRGNATAGV